MPSYEVRFLRSDDTYKNTLIVELEGDSDVATWVTEAGYWQRPLEIWRGDQRVRRHVSNAHEAKLAGWWPQEPRYPALFGEGFGVGFNQAQVSFEVFEHFGNISNKLLTSFVFYMAPHRIWIRASRHPRAPIRIPQHCRFTFHVSTFRQAGGHRTRADGRGGRFVHGDEIGAISATGYTSTDISTCADDGEDITLDFVEAAYQASLKAHEAVGLEVVGRGHEHKPFKYITEFICPVSVQWHIRMPAFPPSSVVSPMPSRP